LVQAGLAFCGHVHLTMEPLIESPSHSRTPERLLEGFNEIRHAVEMRESRLSMIRDTMRTLNEAREAQEGGYPDTGVDQNFCQLQADSCRTDIARMMYESPEYVRQQDASPPRPFEEIHDELEQRMIEYETYRNLIMDASRGQGTIQEPLANGVGSSGLEQTIVTGYNFDEVSIPQHASALDNDGPQPPVARFEEEKDGDDDANSLDDLLLYLRQSAQQVSMKYQTLIKRGCVDKEIGGKVHRVFHAVRKELTRAEKMGTAEHETPRRSFWENMHGMHEKKRPSFTDVLHKVRAECQVAKHWRQSTTAVAGLRTKTLTDAELRDSIHIDSWEDFDVFRIESEGKMSLSNVFMRIWKHRHFNKVSKMSDDAVLSLIAEVEAGYKDTPYHNRMHAADATAAAYYFMNQWQISTSQGTGHEDYYRDIDMMILVFAAAVHDIRHPGVTNDFLVKTRNALAIRYNDTSVLENYHAACAFELMRAKDCDILEHNTLNPPRRGCTALRSRVINMILSTDMARHKEIYENLAREVAAHPNPADIDKVVLEQNVLHCADIAHPLRTYAIHHEWSERVRQEFFNQGDEERQLGFEPVALFDRNNAPPFPKGQLGFINFVFMPAWKPIATILGSGKEVMERLLSENLKVWELQAAELEKKSAQEQPAP